MTLTTIGEPKDLATLYGKIARVTAAMKRVPKNGENKFQHYKYATESDIVDTLRSVMAEERIAIIPSVDATERIDHPNERLGPITRLFMTFTVACGDTGAAIQLPWIGDGQDTADKGLYKAYTGAEKYFLMKLFLVATGDDPEQDSEPQRQERPQPQPQRQPVKPQVSTTEAADTYWNQFGGVVGGVGNWQGVGKLIGREIKHPSSVEEWRSLYRMTDQALKAEAAQVEA